MFLAERGTVLRTQYQAAIADHGYMVPGRNYERASPEYTGRSRPLANARKKPPP